MIVNMITRFGQVERQYVPPRDPKTQAQIRIRSILARVSARWRTITEQQRQAWGARGREAETKRRLGRKTYLTGSQLFNKINCARVAIGLGELDDPPDFATFPANPVEELMIGNALGTIALQLRVAGALAEHTLVLGAAPCSAGRSMARHFVFLGFVPQPVGGLADITALYVARFGVPPVGAKVFIRTQQHINGWTDLPQQISAIVPSA